MAFVHAMSRTMGVPNRVGSRGVTGAKRLAGDIRQSAAQRGVGWRRYTSKRRPYSASLCVCVYMKCHIIELSDVLGG